MRIAVLERVHGSAERNIEFSRGMFTAEGLGELSVEDLRRLEAANMLVWASEDTRLLALGYSREPALGLERGACPSDVRFTLAAETEVVYVPPHRVGSKTEAELRRIVEDMADRGWNLVEDTRVGASGGHLTFQRSEPIDSALLAALTCAS